MSVMGRMSAGSPLVAEIAETINRITGVQLTGSNISQVESKVTHRMLELGLRGIDQYETYFYSNYSSEIAKLITLLTTHYTYFFREFTHFEYLVSDILPEWVSNHSNSEKFKVWSAACSRGQECYSLAMALDVHLKNSVGSPGFEIFGTDVDPESVEIARNGVYRWDELKKSPSLYLQNHWMKGTGDIKDYVRAKDSLRSHCKFDSINLIENQSFENLNKKFDLIFCRNVLIYFDPETTKKVISNLVSCLEPDGYLIIGLSESLHGLNLPVESVGPSVYRKAVAKKEKQPELQSFGERPQVISKPIQTKPLTPVAPPTPSVARPTPQPQAEGRSHIRVLCVDDSKSVLKVLEKVFTTERGFEIIGKAGDGVEANQMLESLKPDVITLDIHMPNMDGIQFLQSRRGKDTPPIVMLTSVSRESVELAGKAFDLGARDYVEKPSFQDFDKRADEISSKVKMAAKFKFSSAPVVEELDKQFQKELVILRSEKKLRIMAAGPSDREKLKVYFSKWPIWQSPTLIVFNAVSEVAEALTKELAHSLEVPVQFTKDCRMSFLPGRVYVVSAHDYFESGFEWNQFERISSMIFTGGDSRLTEAFIEMAPVQILVEDPMESEFLKIPARAKLKKDYVPETSFRYMSDEYLSEV